MKKLLIIIVALGLVTGFGLYTRQLIHETVETRNPGQTYLVSFGDSVAAGAGLSGKRQPGCDLSDAAYPLQVASQQHEQLEQFACSGATVASSAAGNTNDLVTQLKMAKSFIPGSNVVVTAGANDIGWLNLLLTCTQANCATDMNQAQIAVKLRNSNAITPASWRSCSKPDRLV